MTIFCYDSNTTCTRERFPFPTPDTHPASHGAREQMNGNSRPPGKPNRKASAMLQQAEEVAIAILRQQLVPMLVYGQYGKLTIEIDVRDGDLRTIDHSPQSRQHFNW